MRLHSLWWLDYELMRLYGNGRVQSAWKACRLLSGRRVRISPRYWRFSARARLRGGAREGT